MTKMKSRKSISRRTKVTASGKIMRRSSFNRHLKRSKTSSQLRRLGRETVIRGVVGRKISKLLRV